ncbi:MAG TPA: hypothetical protein V6D02_16470 [Candidatus Obscuribacterales bacterium]
MSYLSSESDPDQSLMAPADDIRVLGETGMTVVYLFPDGRALAERETPDFDSLAPTPTPPAATEVQLLDEQVAAGKMSEAQKAVVLHDQAATGMSIEEILTARGWR